MNSPTSRSSRPPRTRCSDHVDTLHGQEIPDPYRWLEDVGSAETASWVRAQQRHTEAFLANVPFGDRVRERVESLSAYESIGMPIEAGERVFFTHQRGSARQPSLVWAKAGEDETSPLVCPETLTSDGTVSVTGFSPSSSGRYVAYGLSEAGSDWQTWFILDTETGDRLDDELHWIRFTIASWLDDESGFFYSASEPPPRDAVYKAPVTRRSIRFHRLGDDQTQDQTVFELPEAFQGTSFGRVTADNRYLVITTQRGTYRQHRISVLDLRSQEAEPVDVIPTFESMFVFLGSRAEHLFFWTNDDAPYGRIIDIDLHNPNRGAWREIVGASNGVMTDAAHVGGRFVVSALVDAESVVRVFDGTGAHVQDVPLPGRGTVDLVDGREDGANAYLWYSDPACPPVILRHDVTSGETAPFRPRDLPYDPGAYVTERILYTGDDGTKIPMFLSRKRSTQITSETPTCLYGYGGFNIAQSPRFRLDHLAWMDMGGQLAVACIRGGGEFGKDWHQAGAREHRPTVFADFIAAAEWLTTSGRASTPKLVIHGRSNGGLLVGACMTKRPDLYGACLPAVGVLDMLRFHKFTVGAFWVSDYGSPDDPDMFPVLLGYSPLHNITAGTAYPPTLVSTADHDDRVFPAHSFKFAATLQAAQTGENPVLLRVETRAGHGMGKPKDKWLDEIADNWIFAFAALDVVPRFD